MSGDKTGQFVVSLTVRERAHCPGCGQPLNSVATFIMRDHAWCQECAITGLPMTGTWEEVLKAKSLARWFMNCKGVEFYRGFRKGEKQLNALELWMFENQEQPWITGKIGEN